MTLERISIPKDEFIQRKKRTLSLLNENNFDGLIAFSSYQEREGNVVYLCNHHNTFPNGMSHIGLGHAAFLLQHDGTSSLVAPLGYQPGKVFNVDQARTGSNLVSELVRLLKDRRGKNSCYAVAGMDVIPAEYFLQMQRDLPDVQFVDGNAIIEGQRQIKTANEIAILRQAGEIAGKGLKAGLAAVKAGVTQHEIELVARKAALAAGADFIPRVRVSTGKSIETLTWPMATDQSVEEGDFVFLDLIGWAGNYGFDNSRVVVVGKPNPEQKAFLEHMAEATGWMIGALKPGKEMEFVYTESRGRSILPMAHGIGLEICENPWININQRFVLKPGMALCVEPILVASTFGGMTIEDTVLITETGVELLTDFGRLFF